MRTLLSVLIIAVICVAAVPILFFTLVIVSSLFYDPKKEYDHDSRYVRFLLNTSSFFVTLFGNIKLHITGAEQLPDNSRFFLVSNHFSKFDPILTWYALRSHDVSFISKPENFSVPFYGGLIKRCLFQPIDRENPKNAIRTINRAAELMKADEVCVGVYPEGRRNFSETLLPFHNGLFRAPQKAAVPVAVMTIWGTQYLAHKRIFARTDVYIDILGVYGADDVCAMRTDDIGDKAKAMIEQSITNHQGGC